MVGVRTDNTNNELAGDQSYSNISVLQEIGQLLLPGLQHLRHLIKPSETDSGDAISAIVVALQMIAASTKKLKYKRQIILVTSGRGSFDADGVSDITAKIKSDQVDLIVVGVDFDDPDFGFKEKGKSDEKARNEATLKALVEDCDGILGTMQQAIDELGVPRLKTTRPVPSYKGQLTLGDPSQYDSALCIDVERYPRVMIRRPMTASQFVQRSDLSNMERQTANMPDDEPTDPNPLTNVKTARTYQVADDTAPGGKKDVDRDDLAKGYEYGRTAVHISESDHNVTKLETQAGLSIIGFIPWSSYERHMGMSVSSIIVGQKTNTMAMMALSSLIHALVELESYAVARLVTKDDKEPLLLLLAPSLEPDYECLLDVQLPFHEDVRAYKFPPLDRVITVSGKSVKEHRNLPSDALTEAMSAYVDEMDLSTFGADDEGNPAECMPMSDTYSPALHRIDQAVRWRAVHPTEPIPPPYEILTRYQHPPQPLIAKSKRQLETLITVAEVKKVPPKAQSRKRARNEIKPLSGLDVGALLTHRPNPSSNDADISNLPSSSSPSSSSIPQLSAQNPIPEFKQALDNAASPSAIKQLAHQFATIIEHRIRDSFSDVQYPRAIEELSVLRTEMMEMEEPDVWNGIVRDLKGKILEGQLGGERREMWVAMVKSRGLGLLEKRVSHTSSVGEEEARLFLSSSSSSSSS